MELMTRKEAAEKLRIGVRTLDRRLATGELKCYRLGDGPRAPVRISEEQLHEYLEIASSDIGDETQEQATAILGLPTQGRRSA
jgi:excisionase family DNA binding protein